MGSIGQIQGRNDLGTVDHLINQWLVLGNARADQFDNGILVESCTLDSDRHKLCITTHIRMHMGNRQGNQLCQQGCRRIIFRLQITPDKDVIDSRFGLRDRGYLYRAKSSGVARIVGRAGGGSEMTDEKFIGGFGITGTQRNLQRLVLGHRDLEEPLLSRGQCCLIRHIQKDLIHPHGESPG